MLVWLTVGQFKLEFLQFFVYFSIFLFLVSTQVVIHTAYAVMLFHPIALLPQPFYQFIGAELVYVYIEYRTVVLFLIEQLVGLIQITLLKSGLVG